ncbi:hypothetical protein [Streptomyces griseochromogenes]|uniref:hypothetical protein n=1 Tax=Streptomyces griseochromogenes TaxID=68214 RepID=UPI000A6DD7B7|nr:hypothetical protein [Streptomyces griseochromogenes]
MELATAFHHAVRGEHQDLAATIGRLRELTVSGDFAYFVDVAHFMAGLPLPGPSAIRWTEREEHVRWSAWLRRCKAALAHLLWPLTLSDHRSSRAGG